MNEAPESKSEAAAAAEGAGAEGFRQSRAEISRNRRAMFRRLRGYVRRNRRDYYYGVAATLLYAACFGAFPKTVQWAVDALVQGQGARRVGGLCALVALCALARSVFRFFSRVRLFNAAREIEFQLRDSLFAHLQKLPQSFYGRFRTGDLMSRAVNDLTAVRLMLGVGLLQLAQTPVMIIVSIGMMAAMNWQLALLMMLPLPFFIVIARAFGQRMHASNLAVQHGLADLSNYLQERVAGISVVKAYAMEPLSQRGFNRLAQALYSRWMYAVKVQAGMPALTGLLPNFGILILFVFGGQMLLGGELTLGEFFAFFFYNVELTMPLFFIGWMFNLVQRGTASMQRIDEILSIKPAIADRPDVLPVHKLHGEIEFRNLTFAYAADAARGNVLHNISLRVPKGKVVGIVGPVGAGKSTLISLISRLYEFEDGMVLLDGNDVNRIPLATLRREIAVVPQDAFLFSMTLAQNIAYGVQTTEIAQVRAAAERAQLAKDVLELPHGFSTLVGERGVMLSGGQRQRAALARALVRDARILILDDTLSAVDAETESAIQKELQQLFVGRSVLVVASRVHSVRHADWICVLESGRMKEQGTHETLMAAGGLYSRLAREDESEERRKKLAESMVPATAAGGGA